MKNMLKVYISKKFEIEKKYIIEIFFKWLLKIDYEVFYQDYDNYTIILPNGNKIEIVDKFFFDKDDTKDLTQQSDLPSQIEFTQNKYLVEDNIPVLFGNSNIEKSSKGNETELLVNLDVFAAGFFTITRMEEMITKDYDQHLRAIGKKSLAFKNNYLHRPIINEYAEMLWNMLLELGFNENLRRPIGYELIPTHDVDMVYYKFNWKNVFADIILDKNINLAIKRVSLPNKNYWDTFDWIMDQSEKINQKSIFYFMPESNHKLDNKYTLDDNFIREKLERIKNRGHIIGMHPGYNTMLNQDEWLRQKNLLEDVIKQPVEETRQHYLRFKIPETLSVLNSTNIKTDSSLGYADVIGFRCGTSCEFPLFDLKQRKKLNFFERPLIIMDIILRDRRHPENSAEQAIGKVDAYKETCRKYQIPITILFHNNSFDPLRWNGWKDVYENYFLK